MPGHERRKRIREILSKVDGLVLAVIGFIILYAFSAMGVRLSFLWNLTLALVILGVVAVYYLLKK